MQELKFLDRLVIRSVFHKLREYAVQLGYFPDISQYNDPPTQADIVDYKNKLAQIKTEKGFYIEFFSESSARSKGEKDCPRIVVALDRSFNGDIGAPPNQIIKNEGLENFSRGALPGQATNLIVAVYLISRNSEQTFVLNGIKDNVLGERNYIPIYGIPENDPFYIYRTGYYNLDEPTENITERAYLYTVPDAFLGDTVIYDDNLSPIREIKVEIERPEDDGLIIP